MEPQLIIFDLDGTLIDSRADLTAGVNHMRAHYGLEPLSLETVSGYIGNGTRELVERALQGAAVDVDEAMAINKAYYGDHLVVDTYLYDGVAEGIPELVKAGHKVALLTNKPGDPSREILRLFGLRDYFCAVVGGGDVPNLKPEPDGIFACAEAAGMALADAWMVGDNYTDLAVAENAGVKNAYARYGFGDPLDHKADVYFASFSELVGYFL
ncbi:HAD family hydrolase [Pontiella sp.]|uniref:HAD family hydrolase n=1 Tax=Pontiella sp. TaxID=2837462 RepID=UPI003562D0D2